MTTRALILFLPSCHFVVGVVVAVVVTVTVIIIIIISVGCLVVLADVMRALHIVGCRINYANVYFSLYGFSSFRLFHIKFSLSISFSSSSSSSS